MQENVLPLGERPLLVRVGVHYKFSKLVVDRVEAVDGTYDVLFIGTGKVCAVDVFFIIIIKMSASGFNLSS